MKRAILLSTMALLLSAGLTTRMAGQTGTSAGDQTRIQSGTQDQLLTRKRDQLRIHDQTAAGDQLRKRDQLRIHDQTAAGDQVRRRDQLRLHDPALNPNCRAAGSARPGSQAGRASVMNQSRYNYVNRSMMMPRGNRR